MTFEKKRYIVNYVYLIVTIIVIINDSNDYEKKKRTVMDLDFPALDTENNQRSKFG